WRQRRYRDVAREQASVLAVPRFLRRCPRQGPGAEHDGVALLRGRDGRHDVVLRHCRAGEGAGGGERCGSQANGVPLAHRGGPPRNLGTCHWGGGAVTPASVWTTGFIVPSGLYWRYSTVTARRPIAPLSSRFARAGLSRNRYHGPSSSPIPGWIVRLYLPEPVSSPRYVHGPSIDGAVE